MSLYPSSYSVGVKHPRTARGSVHDAETTLSDCAPRAEWKITPAGGLRLAIAISKAAVTSSVRIWSAMAHPTSLREYKSITVATYAQPSHVFTYVISPHHFSLGRSAQKDRPIRSGAGTGLSPPIVVRFHAFGWRPRRPATFM